MLMMKMEREELVRDVEELRKSTQKRAAVTSDTARLSRRPCCTVAVAQNRTQSQSKKSTAGAKGSPTRIQTPGWWNEVGFRARDVVCAPTRSS